jgi:hypothetical protein
MIRIIIGLVIAIVGVVFESWWGLLGVVFLATGLFKCCLLYIPFNISTAEKKE